MKKELKKKIEELKGYDEKPIGIFGARASGKTMFFTILYGLTGFNNSDEKFSVICNDADSHTYLRENYLYLLEGKLPPRTDINDINQVIMRYFYNKSNYDLKSLDFAGELIGNFSHNDEELVKMFFEKQKRIYKFFANCGGILIFLEPSTDKKKSFDRQNEVNNLLSKLQEEKGKWGCDIPVGIVLTKWDKVTHELNDDLVQSEEEKAVDYIKNHEIYSNIYNMISGVTEYVKIFPISAFGSHKEGDLPPDDLSKPFNLFNPLVWISKNRDAVWVSRIKDMLSDNIPKKEAKIIVELFMENVENESLQNEVKTAYAIYLKKKRKKAMLYTALISVVILIFSSFQLMKVQQYIQINNMEEKPDKQLQKIDEFWAKYGDNSTLGKKLISLRKAKSKLRIENSSANPKQQLDYINVFIEEYESDPNSREDVSFMKEQKKRILSTVTSLEKREHINEVYTRLEDSLQKYDNNLDKYRLFVKFLDDYPDALSYPEISSNFKMYLDMAENETYQKIIKMQNELHNKEHADKIFSVIAEYMSIEAFTEHKREVSIIKKNIDEEFLYQELTSSLEKYNSNLNRKNLKEVLRKCQNYLSSNLGNRYQKKVLNILGQIETLESGKSSEFEFYIINKNKQYDDKKIELIVELGSKAYNIEKTIADSGQVYIGSSEMNFGINQNVVVTAYMKSFKEETSFRSVKFYLEDFDKPIVASGTKNRELPIILKINKNNFKLR